MHRQINSSTRERLNPIIKEKKINFQFVDCLRSDPRMLCHKEIEYGKADTTKQPTYYPQGDL